MNKKLHNYQGAKVSQIVKAIQENLSDDLLHPKYISIKNHKYFGHCYVASETFCRMAKRFNLGNFKIYNNRDQNNISHWWLVNLDNGNILDITKKQYTDNGLEPPYENAVSRGFLTKQPSKRSQILIDRIRGNKINE